MSDGCDVLVYGQSVELKIIDKTWFLHLCSILSHVGHLGFQVGFLGGPSIIKTRDIQSKQQL